MRACERVRERKREEERVGRRDRVKREKKKLVVVTEGKSQQLCHSKCDETRTELEWKGSMEYMIRAVRAQSVTATGWFSHM
jgi:hypothetical protein